MPKEPTYTAALSDKTLFKSEVCSESAISQEPCAWVARSSGSPRKGLALCCCLSVGSHEGHWTMSTLRLRRPRLMPVAKEAFHAWQGIASVFYDKDRRCVALNYDLQMCSVVDATQGPADRRYGLARIPALRSCSQGAGGAASRKDFPIWRLLLESFPGVCQSDPAVQPSACLKLKYKLQVAPLMRSPDSWNVWPTLWISPSDSYRWQLQGITRFGGVVLHFDDSHALSGTASTSAWTHLARCAQLRRGLLEDDRLW